MATRQLVLPSGNNHGGQKSYWLRILGWDKLVTHLHAVVMGAFTLMCTIWKPQRAVVSGRVPKKPMSERIISFLVHIVMSDYVGFVRKTLKTKQRLKSSSERKEAVLVVDRRNDMVEKFNAKQCLFNLIFHRLGWRWFGHLLRGYRRVSWYYARMPTKV